MTGQLPPTEDNSTSIVHATCVVLDGHGCLIIGASGSGKSSLALSLMGLGARLVSDDRVVLRRSGGLILASAPSAISGLIEARGIGLLKCDAIGSCELDVVVDMDKCESARLPEKHVIEIIGVRLPLLHRVDGVHFAPALALFLKSGRRDV